MDRLDLTALTPSEFGALHRLNADVEQDLHAAGLDPRLVELVRLRASHLNGCEFCLDLHTRRAREHGESEQRLRAVADGPDSAAFGADERAALLLADSITRLDGVPDEDYRPAREHFTDEQLAGLVWTVSLINVYNRLAVATSSS